VCCADGLNGALAQTIFAQVRELRLDPFGRPNCRVVRPRMDNIPACAVRGRRLRFVNPLLAALAAIERVQDLRGWSSYPE
jgi:hypothetical protein